MPARSDDIGRETALMPNQHRTLPVRTIRPPRGWGFPNMAELWEHRELLALLTLRNVKVRYKQTILGVGWAVLQPLMTVLVFTLVFHRVAKISSEGVPYPIFALSAMVPWSLFSGGATKAAGSILASASLIKKVYFPRLCVPLSYVLATLIDFLIALALLGGFMIWYRVPLTARVALMPVMVLLSVATALGVGLLLSAFNVHYRDVRQVVPFLFQFWMLATPIAYPGSALPSPWARLYILNPMAGVVEGFRWALLGVGTVPARALGVSAIVAAVVLAAGLLVFQRMDRNFVDLV